MSEAELQEWHFEFGLTARDEKLISQSECDQLLDVIIDWAEQHGYCIGGGFGPFDESD
jgi:hypothetical protein